MWDGGGGGGGVERGMGREIGSGGGNTGCHWGVRCASGRGGGGIREGTLVKIMGTSTCDIMVVPASRQLPDISGLCGIADDSVLPGYYGLEAGQSAVGDIFNWFVRSICPGGPQKATHESLTALAETLRPGESGLLTLDWHNGNR